MNCKICGYNTDKEITIFNFIFPQIICSLCNERIKKANFAIFKYNDEIKKLIKVFKFYGDIQIAKYIAKHIKIKVPPGFIITFPPSGKTITKQRGFIPMELVAKEMKLKYVKLFEKQNDYQQSLLDTKERSSSISIIEKPPKNVVIIDDVITTGTTIKECKRLLEKMGCNVKIIVFSGNYNMSTYNVL